MTKLTVEETNLLSIYKTGSRQGLIVAMNAALPFMDGEMRGFAALLEEGIYPQYKSLFIRPEDSGTTDSPTRKHSVPVRS